MVMVIIWSHRNIPKVVFEIKEKKCENITFYADLVRINLQKTELNLFFIVLIAWAIIRSQKSVPTSASEKKTFIPYRAQQKP